MLGSADKWSDATISVLVCDDAALGRRMLTVALEACDHIEVVAEAADGDVALSEAVQSTPDVIWMGLQLGTLTGTRLIASIGEQLPSARIVVMCGPDDGDVRARALRAGASGFVRREEAPVESVAITEEVAWGGTWLEDRDLVALRDAFESLNRQAGSVQQQLSPPRLDETSQQVLDALAGGQSPGEVAANRATTEATVRGVVANALAHLHRYSRSESMAYAADEQASEQA